MTTLRWALIAILTMAGPATASAQVRPSRRPADLLKKLSLTESNVSGSWIRLADGSIRCESEEPGRLRLGKAPDEEYDVVVAFTRQEGKGRLGILLSYDGLDFGWYIGEGRNGAANGFALLDEDDPSKQSDHAVHPIPSDAKKRTVRLKVRRGGVTAWLGKKKIGEVTDYYDMAPVDKNESVGPVTLGVLCDRPSIIIHSISLMAHVEDAAEDSKPVSWRERSETENEDEADTIDDVLPMSSTWNGVRTTLNHHGDIHCNMKVIERNGPVVVMRTSERGLALRWTFSLNRGNLILQKVTQESGYGSVSNVQASGTVALGRIQINYQWVYSGPRAARTIVVGAIYLEED